MASVFKVLKMDQKHHIAQDGAIVYTVPSFIRLDSREQLERLATKMSLLGTRDIDAIMDFERTAKTVRRRRN